MQEESKETRVSVFIPRDLLLSRQMARAAVTAAQQFQGDIDFCAGAIRIDAKSTVMATVFLEVCRGRKVEIVIKGADAERVIRHMTKVFAQSVMFDS
jgi:phosphotransferase system HPr-like phosphotransfer protein